MARRPTAALANYPPSWQRRWMRFYSSPIRRANGGYLPTSFTGLDWAPRIALILPSRNW
jgi:hypothetical protein